MKAASDTSGVGKAAAHIDRAERAKARQAAILGILADSNGLTVTEILTQLRINWPDVERSSVASACSALYVKKAIERELINKRNDTAHKIPISAACVIVYKLLRSIAVPSKYVNNRVRNSP